MKLFDANAKLSTGAELVRAVRGFKFAEVVSLLCKSWAAAGIVREMVRRTLLPGHLSGAGADEARVWLAKVDEVLAAALPHEIKAMLEGELADAK